MPEMMFTNTKVLVDGEFNPGQVLVGNDGRIAAVVGLTGETAGLPAGKSQVVDLGGKYLVPGFFDLHFHGLEDKTTNGSELSELAAIEIRHGVTGFTPTLCAAGAKLIKLIQTKTAQAKKLSKTTRCHGFYLEGPFVSLPGAIPAECLMGADLGFARELIASSEKMIRVIMISPELPGAVELIELMVSEGITVTLGHTAATIEQTRRAIDAGARLATHIYNVYNEMPKSPEPGVWPVGAYDVLVADDRVTCELICDGIHVHPVNAKIVGRAKGPEKVALITDSNVGAGLKPGRYEFPGWPPVRIQPGDAVRDAEHGWLCGSSITVDEGIRRGPRVIKCTLAQACHMASRNIFDVVGLGKEYGKIAQGYMADFAVLDEQGEVLETFVGGEILYKK
jgi:N-acetylglucosamine-6-phosphate deacetylase